MHLNEPIPIVFHHRGKRALKSVFKIGNSIEEKGLPQMFISLMYGNMSHPVCERTIHARISVILNLITILILLYMDLRRYLVCSSSGQVLVATPQFPGLLWTPRRPLEPHKWGSTSWFASSYSPLPSFPLARTPMLVFISFVLITK